VYEYKKKKKMGIFAKAAFLSVICLSKIFHTQSRFLDLERKNVRQDFCEKELVNFF